MESIRSICIKNNKTLDHLFYLLPETILDYFFNSLNTSLVRISKQKEEDSSGKGKNLEGIEVVVIVWKREDFMVKNIFAAFEGGIISFFFVELKK